jgi:hypothetical protein
MAVTEVRLSGGTMAKMASGTIGLLVLLVVASGTAWAEQREARLLRGPMSPMTERPTAVACTLGQITNCNGVRDTSCTSECKIIANCAPCRDKAYNDCVAACR